MWSKWCKRFFSHLLFNKEQNLQAQTKVLQKKGNIFGSFLWSMNLHIHIEDVTNATTFKVRKNKTFVI